MHSPKLTHLRILSCTKIILLPWRLFEWWKFIFLHSNYQNITKAFSSCPSLLLLLEHGLTTNLMFPYNMPILFGWTLILISFFIFSFYLHFFKKTHVFLFKNFLIWTSYWSNLDFYCDLLISPLLDYFFEFVIWIVVFRKKKKKRTCFPLELCLYYYNTIMKLL